VQKINNSSAARPLSNLLKIRTGNSAALTARLTAKLMNFIMYKVTGIESSNCTSATGADTAVWFGENGVTRTVRNALDVIDKVSVRSSVVMEHQYQP